MNTSRYTSCAILSPAQLLVAILCAAALLASANTVVAEEGLTGHWVFAAENIEGQTAKDLAGQHPGTLTAPPQLATYRDAGALEFDGFDQSVLIAEDHNTAGLPTREMTVAAWVQLESGLVWGGIVSAVEDNFNDESGWILGFNEEYLSFGICGEGGPASLSYVQAPEPFEPATWYYVVGTYDGETTSLYIDGQLVASSTEQTGDIKYPEQTYFTLGAAHDIDEFYPMTGSLHEVRLYNRAVSAEDIRQQYLADRARLPAPPSLVLPNIFSSHMVLQRNQPIPVWGWSLPGDDVTVAFNGGEQTARADGEGYWRIDLPELEAGGPYELTASSHATAEVFTYEDVLVGEVWVCSGQSNMQMTVGGSENAGAEIAAANYPNIRLFTVPNVVSNDPQNNCGGQWDTCSPQTVGGFSGVAYYFGRKLHEEIDVPIGLVHSSWGGSPCEAWVSRDELEANPDFEQIVARANGAGMFNAMIHPLIPYGIRGAIWYQGESNAGRAYQYRTLFPTMIRDWRERWGQEDFPFYFVQLSPYGPGGQAWAELWEAQYMTLDLPNTGMAVITDVGNVSDIHPRNKHDVGRRLALWALAHDYGQTDLVYSGPLYREMEVEGETLRLQFDHTGGGLVTRDDSPPNWFQIAGEDQVFHNATAEIDGDTVVLRSDAVSAPVAARLGWNSSAQPNLMNAEGLPVSPFRTDDWPAVTRENK